MTDEQRYMHEYVWMRIPGGNPERVLVAEISGKMWAGYSQCEPPEEQPAFSDVVVEMAQDNEGSN